MIVSVVVLTLVTLQRLGELALSRRNTRRLLARGAVESGAEHYPLILGLHAAWLAGLWWQAYDRPVVWGWLGLYLLLQVGRVWTIASLGERWTTRILVLPGAPRVRRGPYRWLKHPNYLIVAAEFPILPLAFGLYVFAAVFFLLNLSALWLRIRSEDAAWAQLGDTDAG